jgi:hypothetical protein
MSSINPEVEEHHWGSFSPDLPNPFHGKVALVVDTATQLYVADTSIMRHPDDPKLFSVVLIISDIQTDQWTTLRQIRVRLPGVLLPHIAATTEPCFLGHPYVLRLPSSFFGARPFPVQLGLG